MYQVIHRMSNVSMDNIFRIIANPIIPKNLNPRMPKVRREATKVLTEVGLGYTVIDSCPCNNFIYYGAEKENLKQCQKCHQPRYRADVKKKKVPYRKMHYFPLGPRLQAHYRSYELSHFMTRWIDYTSPDEVLRAPADAKTWKTLDEKYDFLRNDPRHVRLGVAMDGFNPFSHNSASHSTWPIVLVNYNLPP